MAWAQEMKNLAAEIKTGHKNRTARISEIKKETRDILGKVDDYMKEMAEDLKNFLAKSEDTRKKDFTAMIQAIRARVKDIKGDTADLLARFDKEMKQLATDLKEFLKKSEATRMTDFKAMMGDITKDIGAIRKSVSDLLTDDYKRERKEAARYWARLKSKEAAVIEEAEEKAPEPKRRGRKKK